MSEELHNLFHKLWTKAVGQEGYVKAEWKELERHIGQLEQQLKNANKLLVQYRLNGY